MEREYITIDQLNNQPLISALVKEGLYFQYKQGVGRVTLEGINEWIDFYMQGIPEGFTITLYKNRIYITQILEESIKRLSYYTAIYRVSEGIADTIYLIDTEEGKKIKSVGELSLRTVVMMDLCRQKADKLYNILKLYGYKLKADTPKRRDQ